MTPEERAAIRAEAKKVAAQLPPPPPGLFNRIAAMMATEINKLARKEDGPGQ
jgi:hypothetical protein